jgi:hypothetical protein
MDRSIPSHQIGSSLTHRCHILEAGNDSFRFKNSSAKPTKPTKEKARNLTNPDPKPSSSRVSSQWKSRVSSRRKWAHRRLLVRCRGCHSRSGWRALGRLEFENGQLYIGTNRASVHFESSRHRSPRRVTGGCGDCAFPNWLQKPRAWVFAATFRFSTCIGSPGFRRRKFVDGLFGRWWNPSGDQRFSRRPVKTVDVTLPLMFCPGICLGIKKARSGRGSRPSAFTGFQATWHQ